MLADIVGFEIKRDEVTSLKRLLDYDIAMHISKITDISDSASREWSIEKALDKMISDWQGLSFELGPWKETGACVRLCVRVAVRSVSRLGRGCSAGQGWGGAGGWAGASRKRVAGTLLVCSTPPPRTHTHTHRHLHPHPHAPPPLPTPPLPIPPTHFPPPPTSRPPPA